MTIPLETTPVNWGHSVVAVAPRPQPTASSANFVGNRKTAD